MKYGRRQTVCVQCPGLWTDQTPTPTRFLKNCEEVGLFNELASSFEHEFKKAADEDEKKARSRTVAKKLVIFRPRLFSLCFGIIFLIG
ncbi:cyclic AMP-dependent transcription factor ATF-7 isoform X4 [Nomascus leucogenys]|uniref:cyclic AMP-dependent transcription factor ATF-7 isoform X4 n=1 Tax=Nomascus leucogenys TaxID=61853 RepID=UPI00122DB0BE|nr:cyclic AMP-dependent transcription factor ATF-7 isoform X4 [Nomascus leucogenys]XP_032029436.1 cyclic AMP-dependent transcription factor ATF-7 isoform X4 [Hylobates moloch]